jgi:hypothetical protein
MISVTLKSRTNPKPMQNLQDFGEMHPHTTFGFSSYQGSGDMTHYMFSKMATILKMRARKKMQFSVYHTKP